MHHKTAKQNAKHLMNLMFMGVTMMVAVTAQAGVIGNETSVFMQNCSGRTFATIEDGAALEQGRINVSAYASVEQNALPPARNAYNEVVNTTDYLQNADVGLCYGVVQGVEIGFMMSYLSQQNAGDNHSGGRFSRTGLSNVLGQAKWTFYDHEDSQMAFALAIGQSRIKNDPFVGQSSDLVKTLQFIYSSNLGWSRFAVNLGYRKAAQGAPIAGALYNPVGDRTLLSLGLQQNLGYGGWSVSEEIFGSQRNESPGMGISATDLEGLLSMRYAYSSNLDLQVGAGVGLAEGLFSPDWRLHAGFNWRPEFRMSEPVAYQPGPSAEELAQKRRRALAARAKAAAVAEKRAEERRVQDEQITSEIVERIRVLRFEYKSARIAKKDQVELKKLLKKLNHDHAPVALNLIGHTDDIGSSAYNRKLSLERAQAVADFLQDNGLRSTIDVSLQAKGKSQPVQTNATEFGRHQNRRVEVEWKRRVASEEHGERQ